jgi:APA family basic amino acid/polyamine antiporter
MPAAPDAPLARRLGLLDVTLIVMGGIIGSGIFVNPAVVAQRTGSFSGVMTAWLLGGAIALAGAFVYAELGARRPDAGGQYAYLREAFHPAAGFVYAWALLLLIQTGGMAASAMTFARYMRELGGVTGPEGVLAGGVLAVLTVINAFGVRAGASTQNVFMLLKIAAILMVIVAGFAVSRAFQGVALGTLEPASVGVPPPGLGAAMVPVLFAYGGWQTAAFVGGEVKDPARTLPRGMLIGVLAVILLYVAVNLACLRVLGVHQLATTQAPAAAVMRLAFGEAGARWLAIGVAVSTLGFLSQAMLTAPRVYWAMARDGLFFRAVAHVHPRTQAPIVAVVLQGVAAAVLAVTGEYGRILDTVVATDWIFFGLTAASIFVLRARDRAAGRAAVAGVPGHPWTTLAFILASAWVVLHALAQDLRNGLIGLAALLTALPVYALWKRARGTS